MNTRLYLADEDQAHEARFGLRLAGLLSAGSVHLQPDVQERLRFAREQALNRARAQRAATAAVRPATGALLNNSASLSLESAC